MEAARRIATNTAWFTGGSILQKFISFAYFSIIAMAFGSAGTGRYFVALSYAALFAAVADWGMSPLLTREVARDRAGAAALIRRAFVWKACFAGAATVALLALATIHPSFSSSLRGMIVVAAAVMLLDSVHLGLYALLRGIQRVQYEAIGLVAGQSVLTVSGIVVLVVVAGLHRTLDGGPPLAIAHAIDERWLLLPYLVASITNIGIALYGVVREGLTHQQAVVSDQSRVNGQWSHTLLLREATPFALSGTIARFYTYVDTFLLATLAAWAAGFYAVPFKIAFAFQFIPLAFMGALYPAMSAASADRHALRVMVTQAFRVLWLVALPIAFGIGVLAYRIIPQFYGAEFHTSIIPLIVLIAALPFIFANFPCGNLLNAIGRQATNTKLLAVATTVNIIANVLLLPLYGAIGAAVSALLASVILFGLNLISVHRAVALRLAPVLGSLVRPCVACIGMVLAVLALQHIGLAAQILAGALVYGISAVIVRAVRWSDVALVRSWIR